MKRLYVGVAIYRTLIGSLNDILFTEADSEEEAKIKITKESHKKALEQDSRAGYPVVFVAEVPQALIDKYATPRPSPEVVDAVISDEQRGVPRVPPRVVDRLLRHRVN